MSDKMKDLINPIKNNFMLDDDLFAHDVCEKSEVRELEQNYREAIEALIGVQRQAESIYNTELSTTYYKELLEKLTDQKWENLKNIEV